MQSFFILFFCTCLNIFLKFSIFFVSWRFSAPVKTCPSFALVERGVSIVLFPSPPSSLLSSLLSLSPPNDAICADLQALCLFSFNCMLIFVIFVFADLIGRSRTEKHGISYLNHQDWRRTVMDDGVKNAWKVGFIFISYFLSKKNSNLRYFKFSVKIYKSFKFSWQISLTNKDPQYAHFWNIVFLKYFFSRYVVCVGVMFIVTVCLSSVFFLPTYQADEYLPREHIVPRVRDTVNRLVFTSTSFFF